MSGSGALRPTPFGGIEQLIVDGNNLLHRVGGGPSEAALRPLLAQLRSAIPPEIPTIFMLDGHPAPGTGRIQRVSRSLEIRHAGSLSADEAIVRLIRDQPPGSRYGLTVVTDDRSLTERARSLGSRTQRLAWLEQVVARGGPTRIGRPNVHPARSATNARADNAAESDDEREPWAPGRGATRKLGNPRRGAKSRHRSSRSSS